MHSNYWNGHSQVRTLLLALAFVLGLVAFAPAAARAAGSSCTVNGAGGADYTSIQAAVDDAGCTSITVTAGSYAEHVTIARDVTISGAGGSTIVDGTHTGRVFNITSGTVTLQNLTIANGSDPSQSGGILNRGVLTLNNSIISGNSAGEGGGISNGNVLRLNNSTISGNSGNIGGGIFNESSMVLNNSTISSNSAYEGGGIFNAAGATLTVNNSTISGNSATSGGGIVNFLSSVTVSNSTISGNSAADGGGIISSAFSHVTVSNTIIANNPSGGDCYFIRDPATDSGGNIATDGSCNFTAASSRNSTDPKLDPNGLQNNGGPTQTIALLPDSPAIDTATADCPDTDQRGVGRPQDGNGDGTASCDIGAFELQANDTSAPAITISSPADGAVYLLGQAVAANYACADEQGGSGLASCIGTVASGANIDTASVGSHSFTVQAADNAGNSASASVSYTVVYPWNGFFQPIDNLPTVNSVKAGSAVPVKFSLGGNYGLNIFAAGYPKVQTVACGSGAPTDEIEQTVTAGASGLTYDAASGQYSYTWKTDKSWAGSCRQLTVRLIDGTDHIALFQFR